ncbi:CUB-like domain-containing protein [Caenorhabditis elegans]|uniref:CUB-like domain-containing protein n=1 Tax=Caenorhabditis elegans TaxID=6239 RepID=O45667_CAEEL|nr:CUB-like domain-containing protein [Caenorhabditis elegans]CAB03521.2 CUB-like domain-containing protein [Caenorhabditis elegans]|eukprot:NP_502486.2 Downstream Of DAF-16 (regulated by DAF-16) [Caenorhabditis elegans]
MLQKLFICLAFATAISAAGNGCTLGKSVNKPVIDGTPVYWPAAWNETQPAPQLDNGQSCSWIVTVPRGYYAKLIISGKTTDKDSRFQTVDAAGNLIRTTQENMEPYYFAAPKFTLTVANEGSATFAFKVVWWPLPTVDFEYSTGPTGWIINATNAVYAHEYSEGGGITLMVFPENETSYSSLRSALVYEGRSLSSANYVSNLNLLCQTKKQWASTQNAIFVVNLEASLSKDILLVQANRYLTGIDEMVELRPQLNSIYNGTVHGGTQMSSLVSVANINMQMIDAQMINESNLTVYRGSPAAYTFKQNYTGAQLKSALPLSFSGTFVQFVVSSGQAVFTFKS